MSILEIVVAVIILVFALKGLKDGLILSVCSFATLFIAIAITQVATPEVSSVLRANEDIVSFLTQQVDNVLFDSDEEEITVQDSDTDTIEGLNIPKVIKEELITNNVQKTYTALGVTSLNEYISLYVAYSIINCIAYIVVFVIAIALLKIIIHTLNLVSRLPVIHTLNKLGGLAVGVIEGILIVWIGFVGIMLLGSTDFGTGLYEQINKSNWLSYLFNNNLILNAIFYVTNGAF